MGNDKKLKYELLLIFDRFRGFKIIEIFKKLPKGYCTKKTLYNYHQRYNQAIKKMQELTKNW